jgi:glucose-6-phosphate 1-dehydrogenase
MTARIIPVDTFDLVVFGGTGDLALRKLLPGLYYRDHDRQLPAGSRIIGVARRPIDRAGYGQAVEAALRRHLPPHDLDEDCLARLLARLDYVALDASGVDGWAELAARLAGADERVRVFYLATAPDLFGPICRTLAAAQLVTPTARVVLEKPIGHDLASARAINDVVGAVFPEERIFRIDHYLGKETVQNVMALRFANSLFEPLWNSRGSTTCRSRSPRAWVWRAAATTTTKPGHCATWCRTICSSSCAWWRWSRRPRSRRTRCATRS